MIVVEIVDRQFDAFQGFVLECKLFWTGRLHAALHELYERKAEEFAQRWGRPPRDAGEVARILEDEPLYREFAWFERHLQRFKYSGRWGLSPAYAARREAIHAELEEPTGDLLALDPGFKQPDYYTAVDIHQHPGGVWSDETAGYIYERGARSTTPLLKRDKDLHERFTDLVLQMKRPKRLLDMGCGFGKSTKPFAAEAREAEVVGIDLAEPCLRFAAREAVRGQVRNVKFMQRNAAATGLDGGSFDVVTSTMMLHEMPPPVIRDVIAESHRLLAPGGVAVHLDFLPPDDPFLTFLHFGHGRRNNEPYMEPLAKMDVLTAMRDAGFRDVRAVPFEEAPGAIAAAHERWRFPWTVIVGEKT